MTPQKWWMDWWSSPVIFPAPLAPIFPADTTTSLSSVASAFCHSTTIPTTILASLPSVASASSVIKPWERIFSGCCWSLSGDPPHPKLPVTCLPADILQPDIPCFQGLNNRWNAPPREKNIKTVIKTVKTWPECAFLKLQNWFQSTDLSLFSTHDLEEYTSIVLFYIRCCVERVTIKNTSRIPQTGKPLMTKEGQFLPKDWYSLQIWQQTTGWHC